MLLKKAKENKNNDEKMTNLDIYEFVEEIERLFQEEDDSFFEHDTNTDENEQVHPDENENKMLSKISQGKMDSKKKTNKDNGVMMSKETEIESPLENNDTAQKEDKDEIDEEEKEKEICETNKTNPQISSKQKKNKYFWRKPDIILSKKEEKMLVAEMLAVLCKVIMNFQVYSFRDDIMLQEGHDCIGDKAIGVIALLVMIWWANTLKEKLEEVEIVNEMMKIFADDVNTIV